MEILIQVPPKGSARLAPEVAYAFDLAALFKGRVTALVYEVDVFSAEEEDEEEVEEDVVVVAKTGAAPVERVTAAQAATRDALRRLAEAKGVELEVITGRNYAFTILETLADYARLSDIVFLGIDSPLGFPYRQLAEYALFETGRPVLLAPPGAQPRIDRVAIAWDATRAATRALHAATPFMQHAKEVVVVSVSDDKDFRSEQSGVELCRRLAHRGVTARFHSAVRGGRDIGAAIVETCTELDADLLVMGAQRHSRLREIIFGSATRAIFDEGPRLPVLLAN